jgi:hypothetical protein
MAETEFECDLLKGKPVACTVEVSADGDVASGTCTERIDCTNEVIDRTMPTAANVVGRTFMLLKEDSSSNKATIKRRGSDVFQPVNGGGASVTSYDLTAQWDMVRLYALKAGVYLIF